MTNQDEARLAAQQNTGPTPDAGSAAPEDELTALRRQVDELRAQSDEWLDKYRRTGADFSNYRKRQERDREQQEMEMRKRVLARFLPIAEDLRRALMQVPSDAADTQWVQGVALIANKIDAMLNEYDVKAMDAQGKPFDPTCQHALTHEPSDQYPAGTVIEEVEKGYSIGNQVLKAALVRVSSGPAAAEQ